MTITQLRLLTLSLLSSALPGYTGHDSPIGDWAPADLPAFAVSTTTTASSPEGARRWRVRADLIVDVATRSIEADNVAAEAALAALLDQLEATVQSALEGHSAWCSVWTPRGRSAAKGRAASGGVRWAQLLIRYELEAIDTVAPDAGAVPLEELHAALDVIAPSGAPDGAPETTFRITDLQENAA